MIENDSELKFGDYLPEGLTLDMFETVDEANAAKADAIYESGEPYDMRIKTIEDAYGWYKWSDYDVQYEFEKRMLEAGDNCTLGELVKIANEVKKADHREDSIKNNRRNMKRKIALDGLLKRGMKMVEERALWRFLYKADHTDKIEELKNLELEEVETA